MINSHLLFAIFTGTLIEILGGIYMTKDEKIGAIIESITIGDGLMKLYQQRKTLKLELYYTESLIAKYENRIKEIQEDINKEEA
jgi:hypothetical protein